MADGQATAVAPIAHPAASTAQLARLGIYAGLAVLVVAPFIGLYPVFIMTALCYAIFQLTIPVAAAEGGGSIHLMTRSWHLARGHYWRLLVFVLAVFVGLLVVLLAGQFGLGSMIAVALGPPDALSLSALVISLVVAVIQAAFTVLFAVMLARIYVQLAGSANAQPGVPRSGI